MRCGNYSGDCSARTDGYIELATPVSKLCLVFAKLAVPSQFDFRYSCRQHVEKVIYFAGYIIVSVAEDERPVLREVDVEYKNKIKEIQKEEERAALKERLLAVKQDTRYSDWRGFRRRSCLSSIFRSLRPCLKRQLCRSNLQS